MSIDDRTTNRAYRLPNADNQLTDDVPRLRLALEAIDADIFARYTKTETDALIGNLIAAAPGALNTLQELAAAMGNDPNFAATVTTLLGQKANIVDVYSKAQSDARYVQGQVQVEMVFVATASQSAFPLATPVINKPSALVSVDGVVQPTSEYSLNQDGTILTLSEGVPAGTVVRVLAMGVASQGAPADDTVTTPKLRDEAVTLEKLAAALRNQLVPAGAVAMFPAVTAPGGWLKANGASVSRTTYAALWAFAQGSGNLAASEGGKLSGQFGPGNGTTTFTLPDLRGEFLRGLDDGRGIDTGRGIGTSQASQNLAHTHAMLPGFALNARVGAAGGPNTTVFADGGDTNTAASGGDEARPRNVALLICIKF